MPDLPRLAVGTIQPAADAQVMVWALMEALQRSGLQVQSFFSQACFPRHPAAAVITGMVPRHLDSWIMSPERCGETLVRGAEAADVALVEGKYDPALDDEARGGRLEPLCRWFNLPRLVVLDAAVVDASGLPQRPEHVDGALLDRVGDDRHLAQLSTNIEALWRVPVLGALGTLADLRARLDALPRDGCPAGPLFEQLGDHFMRTWHPARIWGLSREREFPRALARRSSQRVESTKLTVAIACDEAFHHYFQDTLETFEGLGATVVDFSPLRDESLPLDTDVAYLGCGRPDRYAAALAENHCMKAALRSHLARGGRIYAEGGGAAYLCHEIETAQGQTARMVGTLPAVARLRPDSVGPRAVEVALDQPTWLGERGTRLRGYRNSIWDFVPLAPPGSLVTAEARRGVLTRSFQAIGSLVHVDFAAQPHLLRRFFHPQVPECRFVDPWSGTS